MLNEKCHLLKNKIERMEYDYKEISELKKEALSIIRKEHDWADMAIQRMYDDRLDGGKEITDKTPYMRYCWALFALNQAVDHLEGIEAVKAIAEIQLPKF
ncbi:MAG: hypothetical protein IKA32_04765 [Lentisphaeria bacterium]|nr:hypothetical protein [Lentisphaeria bacterium]